MPRIPGSGKPKGYKTHYTLTKEAAREEVRQIILAQMRPMVAAQVANAQGLKYLITRNKKTGKFERVSKERMEHLLATPDSDKELESIEVWDKDPSVQAFTDLMNRALDKPAEQVQELKITGEVTVIARLQAARKRLAGTSE
jgi:hypothetical protein